MTPKKSCKTINITHKRRSMLQKLMKSLGRRKVMSRLRAIQKTKQKSNPKLANRAKRDIKFLMKVNKKKIRKR